jgi:hypothetical protein
MNAKQTIPAIAKIAPPLLLGVVIFLALKDIFFSENEEKKPETAPTNTETENRRKETETPVFRTISAEIPAKPAIVSVSFAPKPFIPPVSIARAPKIPVPQAPAQIKRKFVTREDLAAVFQRGARTLTLTAAVAALKKIGFGKTAAYVALTPDGRFSTWLQFAPDGIITWTDH